MSDKYNSQIDINSVAYTAADILLSANEFTSNVITNYTAEYERFWGLEELRSKETQQEILDILGIVSIGILTDSKNYSKVLKEVYPGKLPLIYHDSPYSITITPENRVVIGDMNQLWIDELKERGHE